MVLQLQQQLPNSNLDLNASGTGNIEFYNLTTQTQFKHLIKL